MPAASFSAAAAALLAASACAMPVIPGPASQAAQPAWLAALAANRSAWRASVAFTTDVYDNYLLWSPSLHIVPQSHIYDRFLYDPALGAHDPAQGWTVGRFLDDLDARYGGIDGVLLWGTYPNMGVDERSQFDLLEDVPGGLQALKAVVAQFNARGVRVGLPYNPCACLRLPLLHRRLTLPLLHRRLTLPRPQLRSSPHTCPARPHRGHWHCAAQRHRRGGARAAGCRHWRRLCKR